MCMYTSRHPDVNALLIETPVRGFPIQTKLHYITNG